MSSIRTRTADGVSISVDEDLCKGCGICAHVCPTDVFEMSGRGPDALPAVTSPGACTECGSCSLSCPDFAVEVAPHE